MAPLDLRPLALGELFDRAFVLYRRHFWLFVGLTAVPGVFALFMTLAQQGFQAVVTPDPAAVAAGAAPETPDLAAALGFFAAMITSLVLYWVVYMIALGAATLAVSEIYLGRTVTIMEVYGRMRGRIGSLIVLLILIGLRVGGVFLLGMFVVGLSVGVASTVSPVLGGLLAFVFLLASVVLMLLMSLRYGVSIPALVIEGLPPGASIRRSIELTQGRLGRVFLLVLCATLITYAAVVLFQGPFLAGALLAGLESQTGFWLNIAGAVTGTIGTTLTTPFLIIGLALIYYDARIREEGLDLELSLAALDR
jgi:hypothetical protein